MIRVGVDVGGTFTDIVLEQTGADASQKIFVHKVSSTPTDQSVGVVHGIVEVCKIAGVALGYIDMVLHGTTVATNMVIERKGADVGMITTRGFRCIWPVTSGRILSRCNSTCPGNRSRWSSGETAWWWTSGCGRRPGRSKFHWHSIRSRRRRRSSRSAG
jgi:hypothetical protein